MVGSSEIPRRVTAKEFAYVEIKRQILNGELEPASMINEEILSNQLNVSRTPLREGIQQLIFEKLILKLANGRSQVTPVSIKNAKEIFDVRCKLEEIAITEAIDYVTDNDIDQLTGIAELINISDREGTIESSLRYSEEFHAYIYDISQNQTVQYILSQLNDHLIRYRRLIPLSTQGTKLVGNYHQIIECIMQKNKREAQSVMKTHIKNSMQSILMAIEEHQQCKINN